MATRSVSEALRWSLDTKVGYGGYCLKFVRMAYNIPSRYESAIVAWHNAKHRHSSLSNAPKGAFVFMSHPKSKYGHVAIYLGDGKIRTTNSATNKIHSDKISLWESWGYKVLGWSEDINGVRVSGLKPKDPKKSTTSSVLKRGSKGAKVRDLQKGLARVFPAYRNSVKVKRGEIIKVDGDYGPQTEAWVKHFQSRTNLTQSGKVNAATRKELAKYGIKI